MVASLVGIVLTTVQITDKITVLKNPASELVCDVNASLSCSGVLDAWQSSVLGPPNALIGAIMFAFLGSAALAGVLGSNLSRSYLAALWALALFFLSFASWFMYQTAFNIGQLCIWCVGITTSIVFICATLTRLGNRAGAFGEGRFGTWISRTVGAYGDLVFWASWWLAIALLLWIGLAL